MQMALCGGEGSVVGPMGIQLVLAPVDRFAHLQKCTRLTRRIIHRDRPMSSFSPSSDFIYCSAGKLF